MLFFALSDDIQSAKEKLTIKENDEFVIVFPGDGDIRSPGNYNLVLWNFQSAKQSNNWLLAVLITVIIV